MKLGWSLCPGSTLTYPSCWRVLELIRSSPPEHIQHRHRVLSTFCSTLEPPTYCTTLFANVDVGACFWSPLVLWVRLDGAWSPLLVSISGWDRWLQTTGTVSRFTATPNQLSWVYQQKHCCCKIYYIFMHKAKWRSIFFLWNWVGSSLTWMCSSYWHWIPHSKVILPMLKS